VPGRLWIPSCLSLQIALEISRSPRFPISISFDLINFAYLFKRKSKIESRKGGLGGVKGRFSRGVNTEKGALFIWRRRHINLTDDTSIIKVYFS
jgi:hypothetical protein